jgi:hypothetical protein
MDRRDSRALEGGQQHAPQRVADGEAEAPLQRLGDDGGLAAAILARLTRSAVLDALAEDYVRTARAKGLSRGRAIWRHAVPNALIPVVTIMGLQFSFLLAGTIIIENVFYLPGIGRLTFQAIAQRDLTVREGPRPRDRSPRDRRELHRRSPLSLARPETSPWR